MARQGATPPIGPEAPVIITEGDTAATAAAAEAAALAAAAHTGAQPGAAIPPIPVELPGPGAGALQAALPAQGFETVALDQEGRDPRARGPHTFDTGLDFVSRHQAERAAALPFGSVFTTRTQVVDAAKVEGERLAISATNIIRNKLAFPAGSEIPVDYVAYTELVQIGAVVATAWDDLERVV